MRRFDKALQSVNSNHRQEGYIGPLASTSAGGHNANVNNLYNSQVRDAKTIAPYGISSRPLSGMKAQTLLNGNNDNAMIGVYDPNKPKVGVGEVCIYSSGNNLIYLYNDGTILVKSKKMLINISADGDILIDTQGGVTVASQQDINIKSENNVNIECNNLVVNNQTMIVP